MSFNDSSEYIATQKTPFVVMAIKPTFISLQDIAQLFALQV